MNIKQPISSVEQLYAKFENLKLRISNSDNRKSNRSVDKKPLNDNYVNTRRDYRYNHNKYNSKIGDINLQELQNEQIKTQQKQKQIKQKKDLQNTQIFNILNSKITKFIQKYTISIEKKYQLQINLLNDKITRIIKNLDKIHGISYVKIHKKDQKCKNNYLNDDSLIQSLNFKQNLSSTTKINIQNQTRCETYYSLTKSDNKIHIIDKHFKEESLSIHQNQGKQLNNNENKKIEKTINFIQPLDSLSINSLKLQLLSKQQQISQLMILNQKLKKMLSQSESNFQRNSQLNCLLKRQNKILQKNIQQLQEFNKQSLSELNNKDKQIQRLKIQSKQSKLQIQIIRNQIIRLKEELSQKQQKLALQNNQNQILIFKQNFQKNDKYLNKYYSQRKLTYISKNSNERISNALKLQRYSNNPLLVEIQFLEAENHFLTRKNNKYYELAKHNQSDQQKFMNLSQCLNNEIRRLNKYVNKLDECAYNLFKGQTLTNQHIQGLQQYSKLKIQWSKKKEKKRGFSLRRS